MDFIYEKFSYYTHSSLGYWKGIIYYYEAPSDHHHSKEAGQFFLSSLTQCVFYCGLNKQLTISNMLTAEGLTSLRFSLCAFRNSTSSELVCRFLRGLILGPYVRE